MRNSLSGVITFMIHGKICYLIQFECTCNDHVSKKNNTSTYERNSAVKLNTKENEIVLLTTNTRLVNIVRKRCKV